MYPYIGSKKNIANETEIKLRLRLPNRNMVRVDTGIWIDVKRWGKNNTINIPINDEYEKATIWEKKETLDLLKIYLTKVIDSNPKKEEITIRSINRYGMYKTKTVKKRCVLYLNELKSDVLADIEHYLSVEGDILRKRWCSICAGTASPNI